MEKTGIAEKEKIPKFPFVEWLHPAAQPIADAIKRAEEKAKLPERRSRRPDQQIVDEVRIVTVPRYKTSKLSGNEWRTSSSLTFYRKGRVLHEEGFRTVEDAINYAQEIYRKRDFSNADIGQDVDEFCDQEGCSEPFTRTYKMKTDHCDGCGAKSDPYEYDKTPQVRKFCERHAQRGNCGLNDSDSNYEAVIADGAPALEPPATRQEDISKSILGGIISASL